MEQHECDTHAEKYFIHRGLDSEKMLADKYSFIIA